MLDDSQLVQLQNLSDVAQTHLVIYNPQAGPSILASAGAWYLALKEAQKDVRLASLKKPKIKEIIGLEATEMDLGKQNLTISFDYDENAVDKISYHIGEETKKFYLTIKPKKNYSPLNTETIEYSYTGFEADIIYLFGVDKLEDLDKLYFGYEEVFQETPIVSFHHHQTKFGTIKVVANSASLNQDVFSLMARLSWPVSPDSATNLLYGIEAETDGLRSRLVTAETFDVVARLMKLGARRVWKPTGSKLLTTSNKATTKQTVKKKTATKTEVEVKS